MSLMEDPSVALFCCLEDFAQIVQYSECHKLIPPGPRSPMGSEAVAQGEVRTVVRVATPGGGVERFCLQDGAALGAQ